MLGGRQHFTGQQCVGKRLIPRLSGMSFNPQSCVGQRYPLHHQRYLPLRTDGFAMRYPRIGMNA